MSPQLDILISLAEVQHSKHIVHPIGEKGIMWSQIAKRMGYALAYPQKIYYHLGLLRTAGLVERVDGKNGYRITSLGKDQLSTYLMRLRRLEKNGTLV